LAAHDEERLAGAVLSERTPGTQRSPNVAHAGIDPGGMIDCFDQHTCVRLLVLSMMAGISCEPVQALPTTTTSFPLRSTERSHRAEWNTLPAKRKVLNGGSLGTDNAP
jgi:hypothetical protein